MKNLSLRVAGSIFALVALVHFSRLFFEFPIIIGDWVVPLQANAIGFIVAALLSFWMFFAARSKKWIPDGYHSISPCMLFTDSRKAMEFYKKVFKAKEHFILEGPKGQGITHAEMKIGNSIFMMGDVGLKEGCDSPETLGTSSVCFYLYVKDVDSTFKKAVDSGATVEMALQDMFWGDRVCKVKDPFGYIWMVATRLRELSAEEIKKCEVACQDT